MAACLRCARRRPGRIVRRTGVPTTAENIVITTGAVLSLTTAFFTLLEEGDEVLVPDPGWPNYTTAVTIARGVPVPYRLEAPLFLPDLANLESLVTRARSCSSCAVRLIPRARSTTRP
jgi:aspartate/methionine/tyrosine aminotransferase